jgi:quinoprotein dehydrogenase-associated probable ABC transporter substrate-binding protein
MSLVSKTMLALFFAAVIVTGAAANAQSAPSGLHSSSTMLRVCADPNNLPFSNRQQQGFENAIANLLAKDLGRRVAYTWFPQRRGFIRNTLASGRCDVVMGVPEGYRLALTTMPYYRSSYVFVVRKDRGLDISSFDDARLANLRIGIHAIGDDYNNGPPAHALAARGLVNHIVGYSIYGDYSNPDPTRALIDAVADDDIDVAIAWGPLAGYFAAREREPLDVRFVRSDGSSISPMRFAIAMGVRKDDVALQQRLNRFIAHHFTQIDEVLQRFDVPIVMPDQPAIGG